MTSKTCTKCGEVKSYEEMSKDRNKNDGMGSKCKKCKSQAFKKYREKNPEKVKESQEKYREKNPEVYSEYREKNREVIREKFKEYYYENREERLQESRDWHHQNKGKVSKRKKQWRVENRDRIYDYRNTYRRERRKKDELFRLKQLMRSRIGTALRAKGYSKNSRTHEILGCSYKHLKEHLENNPYGFTVDDPEVDVDHTIPLSTATTEKELLELCHYTNLQLLPSEYNRDVKKDKPFDLEDFDNWLIEKVRGE